MLDVTSALRPERAALLDLLEALDDSDWGRPTECPAYDVQGVATHVLGDDLSLLSRQRDGAVPGVIRIASELPGADFRTLLDAFNDRWVVAASFFSPAVLIELLRVTGDWTANFYEGVDLAASCGEPIMFFGTFEPAPYWQAVAREYVERWVHHSQIRRALGLGSLAEERFVRIGVDVIAAAGRVETTFEAGRWTLGPVELGDSQLTADLVTRAHSADEVRALVQGPPEVLDRLALTFGRPA
jgi:uncharacterized protein (TIGR03083 family)